MREIEYNPHFLSEFELIESYCVRFAELESLIETLRETDGISNVHRMVIGPRGSGKTTLLLRVAAEVRRDSNLYAKFFPLVLSEERYEVATCGEFWLECLGHLATCAPSRKDQADLHQTYESLRTVKDDVELGSRCLVAMLDFAHRQGKCLLVIAENLNMMFAELADRDAGWRLRKVLQTRPEIMLFGSATTRFDEIDHPAHALYGSFGTLNLSRLDTSECAELWRNVSGRTLSPRQIRPVEILTGGSPRLVAIMARFAGALSFRRLLDELLQLVDSHTEYFKSHLESLPPQERRVFIALADLWNPSTTREIANRARLETTLCSAHLRRLMSRGFVIQTGGTARRRVYSVAERLYNIYYLLRKRGGQSDLVKALIRFMASYYSVDELIGFGAKVAQEADNSELDRAMTVDVPARLIIEMPRYSHRLLERLPRSFVHSVGESALSRHASRASVLSPARPSNNDEGETLTVAGVAFLNKALVRVEALRAEGLLEDAVQVCDDCRVRFRTSNQTAIVERLARVLMLKGAILAESDRLEHSITVLDEIAEITSEQGQPETNTHWAAALCEKGLVLLALSRTGEAVKAFDEVSEKFGSSERAALLSTVARAHFSKAHALADLRRTEESLRSYAEAAQVAGRCDARDAVVYGFMACVNKSAVESGLGRRADARRSDESAFDLLATHETLVEPRLVIRLFLKHAMTLKDLDELEKGTEACEEAIRRIKDLNADSMTAMWADALFLKAVTLELAGREQDALDTYSELVNRFAGSVSTAEFRNVIGAVTNKSALLAKLGSMEEALAESALLDRWCNIDLPSELADILDQAMLNRAALEAQVDNRSLVARIASEVLDRSRNGSNWNRARAYWIRSGVRCVTGDDAGCDADISAALDILPKVPSRLDTDLHTILRLAARLGPDRILGLVEGSPSARLLTPLVAALRMELGEHPRVSREVNEVARDLRSTLEALRSGSKTRRVATIGTYATGVPVSGKEGVSSY